MSRTVHVHPERAFRHALVCSGDSKCAVPAQSKSGEQVDAGSPLHRAWFATSAESVLEPQKRETNVTDADLARTVLPPILRLPLVHRLWKL